MRRLGDESACFAKLFGFELCFCLDMERRVLEYIHLFLCRAIKMNLANEGLEAQKQEAETLAKKRKAEEDKLWEGSSFVFSAFWSPVLSLSFLRYRNARGKSGKLAQLRLDQKEKEGQDNQYPRLTSHSFLVLSFSLFLYLDVASPSRTYRNI